MPAERVPGLEHPSGDKRFVMLDAAIRRHGHRGDALIEVLHTAQEQFGYLREDLLWYVSQALDLPPSKVYGVATFYNFFSLAAKGRHRCVVCLGTACYVKSAAEVVAALGREFGIQPEETTPDGELTLDTARCLGNCGLAPVLILDEQLLGKVGPAEVVALVRQRLKGSPSATAEMAETAPGSSESPAPTSSAGGAS